MWCAQKGAHIGEVKPCPDWVNYYQHRTGRTNEPKAYYFERYKKKNRLSFHVGGQKRQDKNFRFLFENKTILDIPFSVLWPTSSRLATAARHERKTNISLVQSKQDKKPRVRRVWCLVASWELGAGFAS